MTGKRHAGDDPPGRRSRARSGAPAGRAPGALQALAAALFWACLAGCYDHRPPALDIAPDVVRPPRSAVIFFPDGMDRDRLRELLAAGRLPNIARRFVAGGVEVRGAVSSLPSITYPNCSAMITGVFPGHHGILGNFWFDRGSLESRDYMTLATYRTVNQHLRVPTVYDLLGDAFTVNIQGHTRRGVSQTIEQDLGFAWSWVSGGFWYADHRVGRCFGELPALAGRVGRWPALVMSYFPGVDEVGHRFGTDSPEYAEALINIDRTVGGVTEAFDRTGLSASTIFVLVSDHGMAPVRGEQRIDLLDWLARRRGMRVRSTPLDVDSYDRRLARLAGYDAVAGVDAGRVAMIHLRGTGGWARRPEAAEVRAWVEQSPSLTDLPAVELVAIRDGADAVTVLSRHGRARIERRPAAGGSEYRVAGQEGDPLGYGPYPSARALVERGWHDSRAWLEATLQTPCPDFVPQVVEMFDSRRTGDVVAFAADGWMLYPRERAGHGSCLARDMAVPMFFAGPDLPRGAAVMAGRLVDLVPTLLELLGRVPPPRETCRMDGVSLAGQLRAAAPAAAE